MELCGFMCQNHMCELRRCAPNAMEMQFKGHLGGIEMCIFHKCALCLACVFVIDEARYS